MLEEITKNINPARIKNSNYNEFFLSKTQLKLINKHMPYGYKLISDTSIDKNEHLLVDPQIFKNYPLIRKMKKQINYNENKSSNSSSSEDDDINSFNSDSNTNNRRNLHRKDSKSKITKKEIPSTSIIIQKKKIISPPKVEKQSKDASEFQQEISMKCRELYKKLMNHENIKIVNGSNNSGIITLSEIYRKINNNLYDDVFNNFVRDVRSIWAHYHKVYINNTEVYQKINSLNIFFETLLNTVKGGSDSKALGSAIRKDSYNSPNILAASITNPNLKKVELPKRPINLSSSFNVYSSLGSSNSGLGISGSSSGQSVEKHSKMIIDDDMNIISTPPIPKIETKRQASLSIDKADKTDKTDKTDKADKADKEKTTCNSKSTINYSDNYPITDTHKKVPGCRNQNPERNISLKYNLQEKKEQIQIIKVSDKESPISNSKAVVVNSPSSSNANTNTNFKTNIEEKICKLNNSQKQGLIGILTECDGLEKYSKGFEFDIDKLSEKKKAELEIYLKKCMLESKNIASFANPNSNSNSNSNKMNTPPTLSGTYISPSIKSKEIKKIQIQDSSFIGQKKHRTESEDFTINKQDKMNNPNKVLDKEKERNKEKALEREKERDKEREREKEKEKEKEKEREIEREREKDKDKDKERERERKRETPNQINNYINVNKYNNISINVNNKSFKKYSEKDTNAPFNLNNKMFKSKERNNESLISKDRKTIPLTTTSTDNKSIIPKEIQKPKKIIIDDENEINDSMINIKKIKEKESYQYQNQNNNQKSSIFNMRNIEEKLNLHHVSNNVVTDIKATSSDNISITTNNAYLGNNSQVENNSTIAKINEELNIDLKSELRNELKQDLIKDIISDSMFPSDDNDGFMSNFNEKVSIPIINTSFQRTRPASNNKKENQTFCDSDHSIWSSDDDSSNSDK